MKRENKNKKQRRRVEKKMIDPPPNISIIILNINVINTQFKRQTFSEQVKKKNNYLLSRNDAFYISITGKLKVN